MSNPLVVVVELDGFQHGPVELTPKCLAVACNALQPASQWFFQTGFLASRPREYLSTYYHQSTFGHGLPLTGPGLPKGFSPNVLRNALDELIIDYYRSSPVAPAPDHFLLFTKEANKLELFEDALSDTPSLLPVEYRKFRVDVLSDSCPVGPGGCRTDPPHPVQGHRVCHLVGRTRTQLTTL